MVEEVKIKDMRMLITPYPVFVKKDTPTDEIAKTFIANPNLQSVYVVDEEMKLVGKITLKTLVKNEFKNLVPKEFNYFNALEFVGKKTAEELMISPTCVTDEDTLKIAFVKMYENDLEELPVVDKNQRLIGDISLLELLTMLVEKKEQKEGKEYLSLTSYRPFHRSF